MSHPEMTPNQRLVPTQTSHAPQPVTVGQVHVSPSFTPPPPQEIPIAPETSTAIQNKRRPQ